MNHGLTNETVARIGAVFSHYPQVEKAVLYGSRAKGTARPGSDIDLTLFGTDLNQEILSRIENELDDLLLPYRFDLSIFPQIAHSALLDHIQRVGVTFYERNPATANRES